MAYRFVLPSADVGDGISPSSGALLYFFDVGTAVAKTTYSDFALTTANANPVVADSDGRFGDIFLDTDADVTLRTSAGTLVSGPKTVYAPDSSIASLAGTAVTVADAGGYFAASNAETVLQEIGADFMKAGRAETVTENMTFSAAELISPILRNFTVKHNAISSASGVLTIDLSTGNSFSVTLTENITSIVFSNVPASDYVAFSLEITQDGGGGAYTVAQPASVISAGGTAPTISTGNDAVDDLTYRTRDGGTTWKLDYSQAYA